MVCLKARQSIFRQVETGLPQEKCSKLTLARILIAKPVSTFAEYARVLA
jgi:hypothetical protein